MALTPGIGLAGAALAVLDARTLDVPGRRVRGVAGPLQLTPRVWPSGGLPQARF